MDMNSMLCTAKEKMKSPSKSMMMAMGILAGTLVTGIAALIVCNTKQARAMRFVKSTENVLYRVGTALCDISGKGC